MVAQEKGNHGGLPQTGPNDDQGRILTASTLAKTALQLEEEIYMKYFRMIETHLTGGRA